MTSTPIPPPQSLYDFPAWYDALHAPGSAAEADLCLALARQYLSESARGPCTRLRWIEPGCGSGRIIRALARRGQDAVGVDVNNAMISYARNRRPVPVPDTKIFSESAKGGKALAAGRRGGQAAGGSATYVVADMTRLNPRQFNGLFDGAYCPHNSIRHLPDDRAIVDHLASIKSVLKKKSLYIVGINLAEGEHLFPVETNWSGTRGNVRVQEVMQFEPARVGKRWVERASAVVVVQTRKAGRGGRRVWGEHATLFTGYDLWCGGVERWKRLVEKAGLYEAAVVDEDGNATESREHLYQLRVLRPR